MRSGMMKANRSMVRLEMMKKKIRALTCCVGMMVLSHWTPARDAQSIKSSFISIITWKGYCRPYRLRKDNESTFAFYKSTVQKLDK